jgi:type IV secretion system protein VirD4
VNEKTGSDESYIPTPSTVEEDGLLVGWSLEHESKGKKPRPVGFLKDHQESESPEFLQPILHKGAGHLMTIASTGAGKGVGCIIPALLRHPGPVVVIDPKGENYAVTARARREMGQQVVLLDPFQITGESETGGLNPLDLLIKFEGGETEQSKMLPK